MKSKSLAHVPIGNSGNRIISLGLPFLNMKRNIGPCRLTVKIALLLMKERKEGSDVARQFTVPGFEHESHRLDLGTTWPL